MVSFSQSLICPIWITLALVLVASTATAQEPTPKETSWEQLLPESEEPFDDPFAKLSEEQLLDLSRVARFRRLREKDAIPSDGATAKQVETIIAEFAEVGIDVDWILSQRERVTRRRERRMTQVDESLVGQEIRIPGYMLPLRSDESGIMEFLLVPWVGACVHTPPPPPNQMIHVTVPGGTKDRGRFAALWLEGKLELKPEEYDLFLVDGSARVKVSFSMTTDRLSDYSPDDSDILAKVEAPEIGDEHSWFEALQIRVALMFTKTMTSIRDRDSSGPLWWGLLVSFLYGLVHTLGPGHGKAVVISYFVGEGGSLKRGVTMGTRIAIFHVFSAVMVVWLMDFAVRQTTGAAPSDYRAVKLASYAFIAVIGAWMLWKALRASKHSQDDHHHHHDGCKTCAAVEKNQGAAGWLALAVGSVPCTGALLVLLFGMANNLLGTAILLVAAISAGMAVAMSGIGVLALLGRQALDLKTSEGVTKRFSRRARIAGAAAILMIGCTLFVLTCTTFETFR
ncbi:ABC-type nickel/cobalt efflux system, permease component RcnA [Rubritalea squalenifaciens DSM 18772]|uniref:ABC-type nickel/cobalt efflux system, permease component RcnA n=1 Tax=Rubritalea squalenifaciens DSM 18772 TaxID=1123071 RepID=A0A1M6M730_9BACT|nr:DUF3299 domain-containing protein [Rubritalea squalenifaciens]SHJ79210.1 ABC-type nickel/cobalt efflux system, permease component RcnA [Rubritalea squalenifaciens DSM 18772]